jgi:hypothetical protein
MKTSLLTAINLFECLNRNWGKANSKFFYAKRKTMDQVTTLIRSNKEFNEICIWLNGHEQEKKEEEKIKQDEKEIKLESETKEEILESKKMEVTTEEWLKKQNEYNEILNSEIDLKVHGCLSEFMPQVTEQEYEILSFCGFIIFNEKE